MNYETFQRFVILVSLLVLSPGLPGCGSRQGAVTYPTGGKVVFADGAPLTTGGIILFETTMPDGRSVNARGAIEADGTFQLSTFSEGDGAVPGKHRVAIRAQRNADDWVVRGKIPTPIVDERLESFETSGIEFTVEPRKNDLTVTVRRP